MNLNKFYNISEIKMKSSASRLVHRLGRLNTFVGCLLLASIFGCLQTIPVPYMSFELYVALEFLTAVATSGVLGAACAFNMEWVTASHRSYLNSIALLLDGVHPTLIGLAAWYFADSFVGFKLSLAVSGFIMIFFYLVLSEPPQWLLARRKYSRLLKSITNAGKINGQPPSQKLINQIENQSFYAGEMKSKGNDEDRGDQVTLRDLFKEKVLLVRLILLSIAWFFRAITYYGIIIGSTKVHENKYISYIFIGMAEIPGGLLSMIIVDRFGRRNTSCAALFTYGTLLLVSSQLSDDLRVIQVILFCISRASMTITTVASSTYVAELWPTSIRNQAFNISSFVGRFGGILATLSVMLADYHAQLPTILYGSSAIIAAVVVLAFLPETKHCKKMPDTIEEALAIGKTSKKTSAK